MKTHNNTEQMKKMESDYVYKQLIPAITRHDKRFVVEDNTGSVSFICGNVRFNRKEYQFVYSTPFWEDAEGICIGCMTENGDYDGEELEYKLTYDLTKDVVQYVKAMDKWLRKHQS